MYIDAETKELAEPFKGITTSGQVVPGSSRFIRPVFPLVVRTPNGHDYGKDLLRQHYQQHKHGV